MATTQRSGRSAREETLIRLVAAARETFASVGVQRSRMDEIARRAGLSRASVYRAVTGREELVELALLQRSREIGHELEARSHLNADDVADALTSLLVDAINISRADAEYLRLTEAIPQMRLNQLMTTPGSLIHEIMRRPLLPLVDRARRQRTLRADLSDDDIIEWIQGMLYLLGPREDLDDAGLARRIRRFALPAIFPAELPT